MTDDLFASLPSEGAREIMLDNPVEEVRDSHPLMLRTFAMSANGQPNDADALVVYPNLLQVRLFIGRLSNAPILAMMTFFESFIQWFMPYLEERMKGSAYCGPLIKSTFTN